MRNESARPGESSSCAIGGIKWTYNGGGGGGGGAHAKNAILDPPA